MNKQQQIERLQKELEQKNEIIKKQIDVFEKLVSKDFIRDLNTCKKDGNKNSQWLITNYFRQQFLLTIFREGKRTYIFKSQLEQLFFDTIAFKFKNENAKSEFQAEYVSENTIRITCFTEQLTPQTIKFYNDVYNLCIPENAKCEEIHDLQEQLDIEIF